ncbi:hypothetical protein BZJ17_06075 [Salinivibrio sp. IB574]|uniref:hybrid sensor histidine kinase/response regulator n=1 Tax=Salinivibrio sp. IB574 TaxID=1909444 RepID=UPI000988E800|nr:ATP-binding protein [Salinivibrio sp. IB574]OOF22551.1 hypothetical protein BZJ17_06075 [Salinivibrio sp. IB574]
MTANRARPFSKSIVSKIGLIMTFITLMVLGLSVSSYVMQERVNRDVEQATNQEIPSAIITMTLLRAAGEMNASMLKYVMGRHESLAVFLENQQEFENQLDKLARIKPSGHQRLTEIRHLYERFQRKAHQKVLTEFDPVAEQWARKQVLRLSIDVVRPIDSLVAELKAAQELTQPDNVAILQYLDELVDENGDMLTELNQYLDGQETSRRDFTDDMATFERYLSLAKFELNDPLSLNKLELISQHFTSLKRSGIAIFNNYQPRAKIEAMKAVRTLSDQEYQALENALSGFARETGMVVSSSMVDLQDILHSNQLNLGYLLLFILFVSSAMYVYIYRTFTQPIVNLADTMQSLVKGDMTPPLSDYQERTDEVGKIAHGLVIFRAHIISRNQAREQLMREKERAESASRAKAQFLATMSHEIRTPMNGVIGMIDMLRRSPLSPSQHSLIATVRESALSLLSIINDILDFSRTEAGKLQFERVTFSLSETVEQVMETVSHHANKRNVTLSLFIDPRLSDQLIGDPNRLKQVLYNLVGNAVKFSGGKSTQTGKVDVWIMPQPASSPDKTKLDIEITDNGIGISQEKLETIFQPFNQAESSTTREYGGSGLGLAICKNIVDLLGGVIRVHSEEGKGTQFRVELEYTINPLSEKAKPAIATESSAPLWVFIDLPAGALRTAITAYLKHLDIKHRVTHNKTLTPLDAHPSSTQTDNTHFIIITQDPETVLNNSQLHQYTFAHVIALRHTLSLARHQDKRVVELFASPLTYRRLVHGLRVCLGLESPDVSMLGEYSDELSLSAPLKTGRGRILVVEDNPTNQQVLIQQLSYLGFDVLMAEDGKHALSVYQQHEVDLVLTDCHMPNMDGYDLTAALRKRQQGGQRIPIIAITANALSGEDTRCFQAGMDDYITKPIELDALNETLQKWLNDDNALAAFTSGVPVSDDMHTTPEAEQTAEHLVLDASVITRLYAGQQDAYQDIIAVFKTRCLPCLHELVQHTPPFHDWAALKDAAHKQKSAAGSIGAQETYHYCLAAEKAAAAHDSAGLDTALRQLHQALPRLEAAIAQILDGSK